MTMYVLLNALSLGVPYVVVQCPLEYVFRTCWPCYYRICNLSSVNHYVAQDRPSSLTYVPSRKLISLV
jgi:hypothetical protein